MVASGSVGLAWAMVLGAGAASSIGACVVFCVGVASPRVVASSLGFAAGVMLYVVFTEIFMKKSNGSFVETGYSADAAYRLATACFFGGIVLTAALDAFVHAMMHWAARRRRRVEGRRASKSSSSSPDAASTPDVVHSRASPAASESRECCGEDVCSELPQLAGTAQRRHRCNSCTALLAARSAAGEAAESSDEGKDGDIEMGSVAAASVDPLCATAGDASAPCSPPRCCARRQPCCAGNPDCCGPTARCYNTGAGPAADEILPGTEAAEVVAVLQSDPHTKDLLRMGIFTGLAIALHNLPEGLATFVGALNDPKVGASIAAAIFIHNDVFDPSVTLLNPGSSDILLDSSAVGPGIPAGGQLDLSFLGTHDLQASGECCTTYRVGPLDHVMFNGMQCPMLASTGGDLPAAPAAEAGGTAAALLGAAAPAAAWAPGSGPVLQPEVQVDYTAIEYLGQPLTSTFSQILLRARKIGSPGALPLSQLSLIYLFASPVEGAPPSAASDPASFFKVQCEWATTGCENVHVAIQLAAAGVPGADFALNVSFSDQAGTLLSDDRSPLFFGDNAVDVFDLLLTLTTKEGVSLLNATQDYSYMETPELPIELNRTILPRRAMPNPRILAYIGGEPAWGTPPAGFDVMAGQAAGNAPAGTVAALLAGVAWSERENAAHRGRVTVHAVYCCQEQGQRAAPSPAPEVALFSADPPPNAGGP